ncbi:MAG: DUF6596 domain-containing protein, partial [Kofleriaceae bacterium]
GAPHLDIIDGAVQEAVVAVLADPPELDAVRHARLLGAARDRAIAALGRREVVVVDAPRDQAVADRDLLLTLLVCGHPVVPADAAPALVLRTVCGFPLPALSRALAVEVPDVIERLARARQALRDHAIELNPGDEIAVRVESILKTLHKIFFAGYNAEQGPAEADEDLCTAAIRLLDMVLASPHATPRCHALQALFLLQRARTITRIDASGDVVPLHLQDRTRWDRDMIERGLAQLGRSVGDTSLTSFHLEAAIAGAHASARTYDATNWTRIVALYDKLLALQPSPVAALHRAIAIGRATGPRDGLDAVEALASDARLNASSALAAATADLKVQLGEIRTARAEYRRALELCATDAERRFITKKLDELLD